jgi:hypothetical protein
LRARGNKVNKDRRAELDKAIGLLHDASEMIESCKDDEQEYYDNIPESMQSGDKGSTAESAIDSLDNAICSIEEAINEIENAQA